jgi:hypothetical protein
VGVLGTGGFRMPVGPTPSDREVFLRTPIPARVERAPMGVRSDQTLLVAAQPHDSGRDDGDLSVRFSQVQR